MMTSNYRRLMNTRRDVLVRSIKRTNAELMRNRVNAIVVKNFNYIPRLVRK